ncbi:MAG: cell wall hydrolase [Alphaproteobacteria bacterium]|nr:cell wall hydrolase [Alphaproteobacteria bacterium]
MSIPSDKPKIKLPTDDLEALAKTIWAEARGEDSIGRMAVAAVILNRVKYARAWRERNGSKFWWGETIAQVCTKAWQFSCWNENDPNLPKLIDGRAERDPAYPACLEVARLALSGELTDMTGTATHYLNPKVLSKLPDWADPEHETWRHGRHTFYRVV